MRILVLFALPVILVAQPSESGEKLTQALISEIQQLRLAIERSTLLGARTQLAISQMQLQETSVVRLTTQLNDLRTQGTATAAHRASLAENLRDMEQYKSRPEFASGPKKDQIDEQFREAKRELDRANAVEVGRAAREGELASQLLTVQAQIAESRARIADMERALDAAIQQLLKK